MKPQLRNWLAERFPEAAGDDELLDAVLAFINALCWLRLRGLTQRCAGGEPCP